MNSFQIGNSSRNGLATQGKHMSEEEQVQEELSEVVQETEQTTEVAQEEALKAQEAAKQEKVIKDKEYNFAELRKRTEAAERALDQERAHSREIIELLKSGKNTREQSLDQDDAELSKLSNDDLATVGNASKLYDKHSKPTKQKISAMEEKVAQLEAALEQQRLYTKYPDLDEVLSSENIELLNKEDPEIAAVISSLPKNSPQQITMAYKYIKKLVPSKGIEKTPDLSDKKRALENLSKPRSVQSVAKTSPIGMANAFESSDEAKKAAYKEMMDAIKRG